MTIDVTHILNAIEAGEPQAQEALLEAVYSELRQMAARQMAKEQPGQTLQPTALVHEVWMRLMQSPVHHGAAPEKNPSPPAPLPDGERGEQRRYFFAAAAEAMRRILVERARARLTQKRGGGQQRVDLETIPVNDDSPMDQVLDVDAALQRLAQVDPQAAELVKLRYFAGFTVEEASETLGLSLRSTHRLWGYAKAWLYDALHTLQNHSDT